MGSTIKRSLPAIDKPNSMAAHLPSRKIVDQFLEIVPLLKHSVLEDMIEVLVGRLDLLSGDCDLEEDDPSGGNVEDEGEEQKIDYENCYHNIIDQRVIVDFESGWRMVV